MANQRLGTLVLDLRARLDNFKSDMEKASNLMKGEVASIGRSAAALQLPFAAIGGFAMKAAFDFDAASRTIRASTGATGERLKELQGIVREVYRGADESMQEVSAAVAQLSQRTGLAGPALKDLTELMLDFADVSGMDIPNAVRTSTRLFGDWAIATDKQRAAMDNLLRVAQTTGIDYGRMMETMTYYGAPLRQLGFTFEQAALLLGKFDKEGVNAEMVIAGLGRSLSKFYKEGIAPAQGLADAIKKIKEASAVDAAALGRELVGSRPGASENFVAAIREGRMDLDAMNRSLRENSDTVAAAADEAESFSKKAVKAWHEVEEALLPLGEALFKTFKTDMIPMLKDSASSISNFVREMNELPDGLTDVAVGIGGVTAALVVGAPLLGVWVEKTMELLGALGKIGALSAGGGIMAAGAATGIFAYLFGGKEMESRLSDYGIGVTAQVDKQLEEFKKYQDAVAEASKKSTTLAGVSLTLGKNLGQLGNIATIAAKEIKQLTAEEKAFADAVDKGVTAFQDKNRVTAEELGIMRQLEKQGVPYAQIYDLVSSKMDKVTASADPLIQKMKLIHDSMKVGMIAMGTEGFYEKTPTLLTESEQKIQSILKMIRSKPVELIGTETGKSLDNTAAKAFEAEVRRVVDEFGSARGNVEATAAAVQILTANGADLREVYEQYGRILEEYPELLDESTTKLLQQGRILSIFRDSWNDITSTISGSFGEAMIEAATHGENAFKNMATSIGNTFKNLFKRLLAQILDDLIRPAMNSIRNFISGLLGSVSSTAGSSIALIFTGTASSLGASSAMGGISLSPFGTPYLTGGGSSSAGSIASSLGNLSLFGGLTGGSIGSSLLGGLFGGGTTGSILGATAGGIGGMFGSAGLASLLTGGTVSGGVMAPILTALMGPIGWATGAGIGVAALANYLYKSPADRAAQETSRDLGGIKVSSKDFESFASGLGLSKNEYKGIRKDLLSSPKYLTEIAYPLAKQQGKVDEFLASLSSVETAWGNFDFRTPFETWMKTGSATALNNAFQEAFSKSAALELALPNWEDVLDATGTSSSSGTRVKITRPKASSSSPTTTASASEQSATSQSAGIVVNYSPQIYALDSEDVSRVTRTKLFPELLAMLNNNSNNARVTMVKALGRA